MKKTMQILLVIAVAIIIFGATMMGINHSNSKGYAEEKQFAQLIMPDGSIISGECTQVIRIMQGYAKIVIDGIEYRCNEWRVVIWKNK